MTRSGRIPCGVNCKMVATLLNVRLVSVRNPLSVNVGPFPAPKPSSIQPLSDSRWRKDTSTQPVPVPFCVDSCPDIVIVLRSVRGASIDWVMESPLTSIVGKYKFSLKKHNIIYLNQHLKYTWVPQLYVLHIWCVKWMHNREVPPVSPQS